MLISVTKITLQPAHKKRPARGRPCMDQFKAQYRHTARRLNKEHMGSNAATLLVEVSNGDNTIEFINHIFFLVVEHFHG